MGTEEMGGVVTGIGEGVYKIGDVETSLAVLGHGLGLEYLV